MSPCRARLGRVLLLAGLLAAVGVPGQATADAASRGTIKTTAVGTSGPGNQPHAGCGFEVRLYGFGTGQHGTISVSRIAPTGQGVVATQRALLSDDPAGGSADVDQVLLFTAAGMGLSQRAPVAQGWHLIVTVHPDGGKGAASKSLWMSCAPLPLVTHVAAHRTSGRAHAVRPAVGAHVAGVPLRRQLTSASPTLRTSTSTPQAASRLERTSGLTSLAPRQVADQNPWLRVKLLVSVLIATIIAGRMVAWSGVRRPLPWQPVP